MTEQNEVRNITTSSNNAERANTAASGRGRGKERGGGRGGGRGSGRGRGGGRGSSGQKENVENGTSSERSKNDTNGHSLPQDQRKKSADAVEVEARDKNDKQPRNSPEKFSSSSKEIILLKSQLAKAKESISHLENEVKSQHHLHEQMVNSLREELVFEQNLRVSLQDELANANNLVYIERKKAEDLEDKLIQNQKNDSSAVKELANVRKEMNDKLRSHQQTITGLRDEINSEQSRRASVEDELAKANELVTSVRSGKKELRRQLADERAEKESIRDDLKAVMEKLRNELKTKEIMQDDISKATHVIVLELKRIEELEKKLETEIKAKEKLEEELHLEKSKAAERKDIPQPSKP